MMRKRTKWSLIIASSLVLMGCILFACVMTGLRWDFTKLSTKEYETNIYEISDAFNGIAIETDTADIVFVLSEDGKCTVECYEEQNATHSVAVVDGILTIQWIDERTVSDYIGIDFSSPKITVYLPNAEYTSILVKASTGDICVENVSAGAMELSVSTGQVDVSNVICGGDVVVRVSTGDANFSNVRCNNLHSRGTTGDLLLQDVVATGEIRLERSTGNVTFDGADAARLFVSTNTGDVTGTLLSEKVFIPSTDTGRIDLPQTVSGGRCEITTSTGDIRLTIR